MGCVVLFQMLIYQFLKCVLRYQSLFGNFLLIVKLVFDDCLFSGDFKNEEEERERKSFREKEYKDKDKDLDREQFFFGFYYILICVTFKYKRLFYMLCVNGIYL